MTDNTIIISQENELKNFKISDSNVSVNQNANAVIQTGNWDSAWLKNSNDVDQKLIQVDVDIHKHIWPL